MSNVDTIPQKLEIYPLRSNQSILNCANSNNNNNNNNNSNFQDNNKDKNQNKIEVNIVCNEINIKSRSSSQLAVVVDCGSNDSTQMSPGSNTIRPSEMHSPETTFNNSESSTIMPQNPNSLSPSSVSPRTLSPNDHRNGFNADGIGANHQNFFNANAQYQTSVPPKKSFCIDALLSKNHQNTGEHSPETNRFLSDDDNGHKYSDDQREYMSSPEDGISR